MKQKIDKGSRRFQLNNILTIQVKLSLAMPHNWTRFLSLVNNLDNLIK